MIFFSFILHFDFLTIIVPYFDFVHWPRRGTDSSGREVVTLGEKGSSFYIEETVGDALPSSNTPTKILLVVDESKVRAYISILQRNCFHLMYPT
jgi:hypothetical protein